MELDQVQVVDWNNPAFDRSVRRYGLVLSIREMLIYGQMIVCSTKAHRAFEHVAIVGGLLNEPLHPLSLCLVRPAPAQHVAVPLHSFSPPPGSSDRRAPREHAPLPG